MISPRISTLLPRNSGSASHARPVIFPPGRAKLRAKPYPTGLTPTTITIGIVEVALGCTDLGVNQRHDHIDAASHDVGSELIESLRLADLGKTGFKNDVALSDPAEPGQRIDEYRKCGMSADSEKRDARESFAVLRLGGARRGERSKTTDDEGPPINHPKSRIVASAFPSQYVMPMSRYIVVAVARCSWACWRLPVRRLWAPGSPSPVTD
jgi:hypothetical protein